MLENTTIILYANIAISITLLVWVIVLEIRMRRLLSGKKARSLESIIVETNEHLGELHEHKTRVQEEIERINRELRKSVQTVETIRFNPFSNTGSNQSFSTAIVNGEGDGVIISSLNARGTVSVYAKPVREFKSEYELSDEEKEVLSKARGS